MISTAHRRRLLIALLLAIGFFIGSTVQEKLGISFTIEGLQDFRHWVEDLGWWGPVAFMLLIVGRLFIGLSSHLVLILGGLAFGAAGGIFWGSLGLLTSALLLFYLAGLLGAGWAERRFGEQHLATLERVRRLGAVMIFVITAHPLGLQTPTHLAAGLVGLNGTKFALAVALAAPIRAAPFALLGTAVLDLSTQQALTITAALVVLFALPLLSARVRGWFFGDADAAP